MGSGHVEGTWEVLGESESSRSFVVEFKGNETTAARRCEKFLGSLRKSKTEWHTLTASSTEGESKTLAIGPDKSKRQVRTELAGKRLIQILKSQTPNEKYFMQKFGGSESYVLIQNAWQDVARIEATEEAEPPTL
eukprot:9889189-Karenia_brevis.AAC.1